MDNSVLITIVLYLSDLREDRILQRKACLFKKVTEEIRKITCISRAYSLKTSGE